MTLEEEAAFCEWPEVTIVFKLDRVVSVEDTVTYLSIYLYLLIYSGAKNRIPFKINFLNFALKNSTQG